MIYASWQKAFNSAVTILSIACIYTPGNRRISWTRH